MSVKITALSDSKSDRKKFINSQWLFYKNDKNWVPPMKYERMNLLDKKKNPFWSHSDYQLYIAEKDGQIVGRIAAIYNDNHNKTHNDNVGFFGFFESINDKEVAQALFDNAAKWLKEKGYNTMRGPMNPSMNDECALLVEGFDSPPLMLMTYNPDYYDLLIKSCGLKKSMDTLAYYMHKDEFMSEKLTRLAGLIKERKEIEIRTVNFKDKTQFEKDIQDILYVYNHAWEPNWGFVKFTDDEFRHLVNDFKQIANPDFAVIATLKGKLAAFALALPDYNQCFIHNKSGSLLGTLWALFTKKKQISWTRIITLGVVKEFQGSGIDSVIYHYLGQVAQKLNYPHAEASWILEDNLMMNRALKETMNAEPYKRYRIFDKEL